MKLLKTLETFFVELCEPLPDLPGAVKDTAVSLLPYVAAILGLYGAYMFVSSLFSLLMGASLGDTSVMFMVQPLVIAIPALIMAPVLSWYGLRAFLDLQTRKRRGWRYLLGAVLLFTLLSTASLFVFWSFQELLTTLGICAASIYLLAKVHDTYKDSIDDLGDHHFPPERKV